MGDWITLSGVKPYDGRYELDLDGQPLTRREWGWIKRHAGYLPLGLTTDTFTDPELITMLAIISMRRAGRITNEQVPELWERFADVPFDSLIRLESDEEPSEDDAGPPPLERSGKPSSSGTSSPNGSETSDAPPRATGNPVSGTSGSVPAISVS